MKKIFFFSPILGVHYTLLVHPDCIWTELDINKSENKICAYFAQGFLIEQFMEEGDTYYKTVLKCVVSWEKQLHPKGSKLLDDVEIFL